MYAKNAAKKRTNTECVCSALLVWSQKTAKTIAVKTKKLGNFAAKASANPKAVRIIKLTKIKKVLALVSAKTKPRLKIKIEFKSKTSGFNLLNKVIEFK